MRSFAASIFLALSVSQSAFAVPPVDEYEAGSASYAQGKFKAAEAHYLSALKAKPTDWRIYYQLGNCFLQLRDARDAKSSYESCLRLQPPADIRKNCEQVLFSLNKPVEPASPPKDTDKDKSATASETAKDDKEKPAEKGDGTSERQKLVEEHRNRILEEAKKQAETIRDSAKKQIEDLKASSGRYYKYDDGSLKLDIPPEQASAISEDAEKRATAILDEARRRAAQVDTP